MARFSQYPSATIPTDYTEATNFLIEDPSGEIKLASLEGLRGFLCDIHCAMVTIPSAEVLTLNSIPVELIAAQGAGTAIEVISGFVKVDFNTTQYATNTSVEVVSSVGATHEQLIGTSVLTPVVPTIRKMEVVSPTNTTGTQIVENQSVNVSVSGGDPTAGDSDIEVYVTYRLIQI